MEYFWRHAVGRRLVIAVRRDRAFIDEGVKQPEIARVVAQIIGEPMDGLVVLAKILGIFDRLVAIMNLIADPKNAVLKLLPSTTRINFHDRRLYFIFHPRLLINRSII